MNLESTGIDRLREAFGSLSGRAPSTAACSDPARIWAAVKGELPAAEARSLLEHSIGCGECASAWKLAAELVVQTEPAATAKGRWRWVAAAAAAALVLAVAPFWLRGKRQEAPVFREEGRAEIRSLVPEDQPQPRSRCLLRWSAGPAGTRYNIRIATGDLRVLASAKALEKAEYLVPDSALAGLPAEAKIFWRVESLFPDGTQEVSMTFVARVE